MPLEYKYRVGGMSREIGDYSYQKHYNLHKDKIPTYKDVDNLSGVPHGFGRECLLEFIQSGTANWFIERGIAVSVETCVEASTYRYTAHLIAHLTYQQREEFREQQIIDKLQNSYKVNK
jgi:hypothetical protein